MPRYRFEKKYLLNEHTAVLLRARVAAIMKPDENGGSYVISNMYLDDRVDSFYHANQQGKFSRDKYRLRYYNGDKSFIRLERKHKDGSVSYKDSMRITREQYQNMKEGKFEFLSKEEARLLQMLAMIYRLRGLRAAAIYSYRREAYVYEPNNVRITFDSPLFQTDDSITPHIHHEPLKMNWGHEPYFPMLLEVKYADFLPETIKRVLNGFPLAHTEMSKYAISRQRGCLPYGYTN
jgi:hypothetical protein